MLERANNFHNIFDDKSFTSSGPWKSHAYLKLFKELNFRKLKSSTILILATGVFLAYFYILSLFFRHTLSHLLILTFNNIHISTCYEHVSVLQFLYLLLLVFISGERKINSSDSSETLLLKVRKKTIFQKFYSIKLLTKSFIKKLAWVLLKKIGKLFSRIYKNGKDTLDYITTENIKAILNPRRRSNAYRRLEETPSIIREPYAEEVTTFCESNKQYIKGNIRYKYKTEYIRKHYFFQVHRKWKRIKQIHSLESLTCYHQNSAMKGFSASYVCSVDSYDAKIGGKIFNEENSGGDAIDDDKNNSTDETDIISSKISIANRSLHDWEFLWNIAKNNVKIGNKRFTKVVKHSRSFVSSKKHLFWPKKKRKVYIVCDVPRMERFKLDKSSYSEKRWFKNEYEKQIGRPPDEDEEAEDSESHLDAVSERLKKRCRGYLRERNYYVQNDIRRPPIQPVVWYLAPHSIKCVCPSGDCSCQCKGNTLLPKEKTPYVYRRDYYDMNVWLWRLFRYQFKPSGTLIPAVAEAAKTEAKFYRSQKGREILQERGPEFCISGCRKFFQSNIKFASRRNDFATEMRTLRKEIQKEPDIIMPDAAVAPTPEPVATPTAPSIPTLRSHRGIIIDRIRIATDWTQTKLGSNGEFIIGKPYHLLFASTNELVMHDIDGSRLQISTVYPTPPEPISVQKLLHIPQMKQLVAEKKKSMLASLYDVKQKKFPKSTQYNCTDGSAECESLESIMRKKRLKQWASREEMFKCCLKDKCCQPFFEPIPELPNEGEAKQQNLIKDAVKELGKQINAKEEDIETVDKKPADNEPNKQIQDGVKLTNDNVTIKEDTNQSELQQRRMKIGFVKSDFSIQGARSENTELNKTIQIDGKQSNIKSEGGDKPEWIKLNDHLNPEGKLKQQSATSPFKRVIRFFDDILKYVTNYTPSNENMNIDFYKAPCVGKCFSMKLSKANVDEESVLRDNKSKLFASQRTIPTTCSATAKISVSETKVSQLESTGHHPRNNGNQTIAGVKNEVQGMLNPEIIDTKNSSIYKVECKLNANENHKSRGAAIVRSDELDQDNLYNNENKLSLEKDNKKSIPSTQIHRLASDTSCRKKTPSQSGENLIKDLCQTENRGCVSVNSEHESIKSISNNIVNKNSKTIDLNKKASDAASEKIQMVTSYIKNSNHKLNAQYKKVETKAQENCVSTSDGKNLSDTEESNYLTQQIEGIESKYSKNVLPICEPDSFENEPAAKDEKQNPVASDKDNNPTKTNATSPSLSGVKMLDESTVEKSQLGFENEQSNQSAKTIIIGDLNDYINQKIESREFKHEVIALSSEQDKIESTFSSVEQKQSKDRETSIDEKKSSKNMNKYKFYF